MTQYSGKVIRKTPVVPTQASASGVWKQNEVAAAVRNNTWPVPGVPFPISRSSRFRNSFYSRTFGTPTNNLKWTWSGWVKLSSFDAGTTYAFFGSNNIATNRGFTFASNANSSTGFSFIQTASFTPTWDVFATTTSLFRDVSAWYHVVFVYDSANATSTDRCIVYVNGVRQGVSYIYGPVPLNTAAEFNVAGRSCNVGCTQNGTNSFVGYMTEINFVDGQALTPSSFGTTDPATGAWVPMIYTGTYGNNGFYLNFKDNTDTTTMGYDYSGNGNHFASTNISLTAGSTYDSMLDVPTPWIGYNTDGGVSVTRGNYCVLNPIAAVTNPPTISNGNLTTVTGVSGAGYSLGTIALPSSGKFYFKSVASVTTGNLAIGVTNYSPSMNVFTGGTNCVYYGDGTKYVNGVNSSYGSSYTTNTIGVAVNIDAGTITFYRDNVSQGAITYNATDLFPFVSDGSSSASSTIDVNFGQRPFSYTPPTGFKALCTTNLPDPTIKLGAQYFAATLYTGNGTSQSILNSGNNTTSTSFQPDLVWTKGRSGASNHSLVDSVRGIALQLSSSQTAAEISDATEITALNSNGFSVGNSSGAGYSTNANGTTYVGWQWKAVGSNVSNTSGTITSTVNANPTAGFSVVTWTGNGSTGTIGHGLGVAPKFIITKYRNSANAWLCYSSVLGAGSRIYLNQTDAAGSSSTVWNNTSPTSTVFSVGDANTNASGGTYVAYCWSEIAGYSAFGSYTGNGSTNGPFVFTGLRARWLLIKRTDSTGDWVIYDTSRNTYNVVDLYLFPNSSAAEGGSGTPRLDILSNGFKLRQSGQDNTSGATYIFAAFAENPFKYSNAR